MHAMGWRAPPRVFTICAHHQQNCTLVDPNTAESQRSFRKHTTRLSIATWITSQSLTVCYCLPSRANCVALFLFLKHGDFVASVVE